MSKRSLDERFWSKVARAGADECWLWTGHKSGNGYGLLWNPERRKCDRAHRVSVEIANGKPVPDGMVVMHSCDTPLCVNPGHLSIGTHSENSLDMVAKGRRHNNNAAGEDHGCAVLTAEQVRYIRSCDKSSRVLARELGVTKNTILRARTGKNWSRVT